MPVTAKLSRNFYEKFGEDVTNEFVDWFNSVDATYRADLREIQLRSGCKLRSHKSQDLINKKAAA